MNKYNHISVYEREEISLGLAQGFSQRKIATSLKQSPVTICCEINRHLKNKEPYRAIIAQRQAKRLVHITRKMRKLDRSMVSSVLYPYLLLRTRNGYIFNFMFHLGLYNVAALVAWLFY